MKTIILGLSLLALTGCAPSDERAITAARSSGVTGAYVSGIRCFLSGCGEHDYACSKEVAGFNAQQDPVVATVCCGLLKRCTVRW